ncbi:class I SAM-dependent methyltransferase [Mumia sp. ZJ1417]|uniref:class I SAM-dependent methyltransferase n=1 Tax=unclassified Mumia TaxID=2621872 RepID=UPI00141E0620|nr:MULTISPECIES: class I SAM-dependent methyltransferase [unclassified Mumia]QMW65523.1 class I SAM-dependent methyltransferase [Mumia sp. ZJ1417]
MADIGGAYDARADEYVALFGSVDQAAQQDRDTIERWQAGVDGRILDAGCGPGHWTEMLSRGGSRDVVGVDASARFLDAARGRSAFLDLSRADLAALPLATGSVGGILSWYSIIHTPPADVPAIVREFARVLAPGGSLLLGFFEGEARAAFDHAVTTAYYWSADALGGLLAPHGFVIERASARQDPGVRRQGDLVARRTLRGSATS